MKLTISLVFLYTVAAVSFGFGLLYLIRLDIMPYHYAYLQETSESLNAYNPRIKELMLALMRVAGANMMTAGIAGFFLITIPYRSGAKWSWWALLNVFSMGLVPMLVVTVHIANAIHSGGVKPPWWLTVALLAMVYSALVINFLPLRRRQEIVI